MIYMDRETGRIHNEDDDSAFEPHSFALIYPNSNDDDDIVWLYYPHWSTDNLKINNVPNRNHIGWKLRVYTSFRDGTGSADMYIDLLIKSIKGDTVELLQQN